jgi:NAD(P)-dependent dehydrogenase (short-subunit alcohol dehydrogenase family)
MINEKVALVTGGARGIGHAVAVKFAKEGYAVAVAGQRPEEAAKGNIGKIRAFGRPVIYIRADISKDEDRKEILAKTMEAFGRVDVLVNNAGVAPKVRADLLETTEESVDFVLGVNLKGTFFLTQLVAKAMIEEKGKAPSLAPRIVNISSMSAYTSSVSRGEYCISKAGISMVTTLFADRLAEYGIPVNEVRPGIICTDMTAAVREKYDALLTGGLTPIRRWGYPEDIAAAVFVLASDALPYSTGEVLNVDGGFHIRRL